MRLEKTGIYALVALIVIASLAIGLYVCRHDIEGFLSKPEVVEIGDCVLVNFIARYADNGTVFDTSYEEIARNSGIYDDNKSYEPLKIFVDPEGSLKIPEGYEEFSSGPPLGMKKGFIKYLIGMKEGEEKSITLSPDEAYGIWNESLATFFGMDKIPRYVVRNCTQVINRTMFASIFENVSIERNVTFNYLSVYGIEDTLNATIIDIDEKNITIKILPVNGTVFTIPFTKINVTILYKEGSNNFTFWYDFKPNQTFSQYLFGQPIHYKVLEINQTDAKVAINVYAPDVSLVNQSVDITLKVEKIYKTSKRN